MLGILFLPGLAGQGWEGRYREFFDAARTNRLTEGETVAYSQSLDKLRETQAGIRYAADKAAEKARAEGMAEGIEKGIEKGKAEGMRIMFSLGIPVDVIAQKFGVTIESVTRMVSGEL